MIGVLGGKKKETLVDWLGHHREIRILSRDRDEVYANAARTAIPQATQVADRFHLARNASTAMDNFLTTRSLRLERQAAEATVRQAPDLSTVTGNGRQMSANTTAALSAGRLVAWMSTRWNWQAEQG